MAWQIWLSDNNSLLCSLGSGTITSTELIESAKTLPDFRQGLDRLTVIDDSASFVELDLGELKKIKEFVHSIEVSDKQENTSQCDISFKTAYVCPNDLNAAILKMFNFLWDKKSGENIEYDIFTSIEAALAWLERPNIDISLPKLN